MNRIKQALAAAITLLVLSTSAESTETPAESTPLDLGGCYSIKPICQPGGHPICLCDQLQNCQWFCTTQQGEP